MHIRYALTGSLLACCFGDVLGQHAVQRRQDSADLTTTVNSATPSSPTGKTLASSSSSNDGISSTLETSAAVSTQSASQSTSAVSTTPSATVSDQSGSTTPTTTRQNPSNAASTTTGPTASVAPGTLPIRAVLTPALGIGGVVLIAAGVALCLVGIKHEWLYIFLSTAMLGGLAVTVLIVYVMNPPVSDAVQGAFLVAAVVTGSVFGAVSLLFKEVTDGLGCLLGGFSFAMWLLVLAPGGIITSTAGRGILIGLLCVGAFALSFSRFTRTYGLIVCTSFAGATATVVGIDCFSRAGLKEFWIYLWNLNDDEFPQGTDTYPITRGIRVEIACIAILFIFGLMSQFKIWNIIKHRRSKKEEERLRKLEIREKEEADVGRDVEAANQRDLATWEATYDDKKPTHVKVDSGLGSSRRTSRVDGNYNDRSADGFQLVECVGSHDNDAISKGKSQPSVSVRVASDDWKDAASSRDDLLRSTSNSRSPSRQSTIKSSYPTSEAGDSAYRLAGDGSILTSGAPPVPPLPFKVPAEGEDDFDGSLVSGASNARQSNRQYIEAQERPSLGRYLELHGRPDDGRASSVAATADDNDNATGPSRAASPYVLATEGHEHGEPHNTIIDRSRTPVEEAEEDELLEEHDEEALARPVTATIQDTSKVYSRRGSIASRRSSRQPSLLSRDRHGSVSEIVVEQLPPQLSRIAQTYRTNEWAKHIADADVPEAAELADAHSPGIQVDTAFAKEAAKPVDVEDLQRVVSDVPPQTTTLLDDFQASRSPYRRSRSQQLLNRTGPTQSVAHQYPLSSRPSASSFKRQDSSMSSSSLAVATSGARPAPTLLASQPLVESPIEDTLATSGPYRRLSSYRSSTNTLMDQRHHQLKQRPTTTSFDATSSNPQLNFIAPSNTSRGSPERRDSDNASLHSIKQALAEDEDMTLAQRRDLVQQHRRLSNPQQPLRQSTHPPRPTTHIRSSTNPTAETLAFDSHQPRRGPSHSALDQSARLAQWRQSLQPKTSAPILQTRQSMMIEENARLAMLSSQRQAEWLEAKKKGEREARESQMEAAMRNGVLHGAHRDALRKMQARARDSAGA